MKSITTPFTFSAILVLACSVLCGCNTAKVAQQKSIGTTPTAKPNVVYVADFDLDAANIKADKSLLPPPPKLPGPFGDMIPGLPGAAKDPKKLARELVDTMSESLVNDLTKAGFTARRVSGTNALPANGWLVRGVFTDVNQGDQLRRAVIGFGMGKTDLQVLVDIADLSRGAPEPFYQLNTKADSGKAPGAGPMIVLCPAGAAARFVIAGKDLDRNVKHTATQIAGQVTERAKEG